MPILYCPGALLRPASTTGAARSAAGDNGPDNPVTNAKGNTLHIGHWTTIPNTIDHRDRFMAEDEWRWCRSPMEDCMEVTAAHKRCIEGYTNLTRTHTRIRMFFQRELTIVPAVNEHRWH